MAYRYRSWDLGNGQVIVIRCEQDCVQTGPNGEDQFVNIKALNEWNPKVQERERETEKAQPIQPRLDWQWSRLANEVRHATRCCSGR